MMSNGEENSNYVETEFGRTVTMVNTTNGTIRDPPDPVNQATVRPSLLLRFSWITILFALISAIQIALFVLDSVFRENAKYSIIGDLLILTRTEKWWEVWRYWRYITYIFVHKDKFHLGLNIYYQSLFGLFLGFYHGWLEIGIIYIIGVVGGSLGFLSITNCDYLAGASAGVCSIKAALFTAVILRKTKYRIIPIFIVAVFILVDLNVWLCIPSQPVYHPNYEQSICTLVSGLEDSTVVHFCGLISGTIIEILFIKKWNPKIKVIFSLVFVIASILLIINLSSLTIICGNSNTFTGVNAVGNA